MLTAEPGVDPALVGRVLDYLRSREGCDTVVGSPGLRLPSVTLADAIASYEAGPLALMSAGTGHTYKTWTRRLAAAHGDDSPQALTAGDLKDLIAKHVLAGRHDDERRRSGRSAEENAVGAFRSLWGYFVEKGWVEENVAPAALQARAGGAEPLADTARRGRPAPPPGQGDRPGSAARRVTLTLTPTSLRCVPTSWIRRDTEAVDTEHSQQPSTSARRAAIACPGLGCAWGPRSCAGSGVGGLLCGVFGFDEAEPEALVDAEPAVGSLLFGWELVLNVIGGNDLRMVDGAGLPVGDEHGGAAGQDVLQPVRVRPVGQRDQEPAVGREGDDRGLVKPARGPAPDAVSARRKPRAGPADRCCRTNLVDYKQPVEIVALTSIPKTPANKIDRRALRALWNERLTLRRSADSPSSA